MIKSKVIQNIETEKNSNYGIFVISSALVFALTVFGIMIALNRINMMNNELFEGLFNQRYYQVKTETYIHIIFGLIYLVLAPYLILNRALNHSIRLHRFLGKICFSSGMIVGLYAVIIHHTMSSGWLLSLNGWLFSVLFLVALFMGFYHVKSKNILSHKKWMIRAFCIALGSFVVVRVFSAIAFIAFTEIDLLSTNLMPTPETISLIQSILFLSSWAGTLVPILVGELLIKSWITSRGHT